MKDGTAILVDGDNVPPEVLGPLLGRLERDGAVTERRIFRNWRSSRNAKAWDDVSKALAFERVDRYRTSAGKNASDIALVVTAMDLLHAGIRRFCIVSGDTDFAPLVERLRRAGAHVTLIGHKAEGGLLDDLADEYQDFRGLARERTPGRGRAPPAAPPAKRARKSAPPRTPAPSRAATPSRAPMRAPHGRGARPPPRPKATARGGEPDTARLRSLLEDCYEVARTDGEVDRDGWVPVDRLGQIARSVDRTFSLANYGFGSRASLSRVIERVGAPFQVEATGRGGNRQYRVRKRE